jgi:hypothetical protein
MVRQLTDLRISFAVTSAKGSNPGGLPRSSVSEGGGSAEIELSA